MWGGLLMSLRAGRPLKWLENLCGSWLEPRHQGSKEDAASAAEVQVSRISLTTNSHKQYVMLMRARLRLRRRILVCTNNRLNLRSADHRHAGQIIQKLRPVSRQRRQRR